MSSTNFVILTIQIFSLIILVSQVSSADYSALLSLLYKRAAASDRPLIVLIDRNLLQSDSQTYKKPYKALDAIAYKKLENRIPLNDLLHIKKKPQNLSHKPPKSYDLEKKLHHALMPMQNRVVNREKEVLRSPIIRNLLRISNNLNCEAKYECENKCNKYSGPNNYNCAVTCNTKYQCDEESEGDGCDECEADSCGDDNCTGSTKGYVSTEPSYGCPEC